MKKFLLYLAIFASPLGARYLSIPLMGSNMSLFRISIILLFGILFISLLKDGTSFIVYKKGNKFSVVFMVIWVIYSLSSILWARDYSNWLRNFYFLVIALLLILVLINICNSITDIYSVIFALNVGLFIQAVIGLYEVVTGNYLFLTLTDDYYVSIVLRGNRFPVAMAGNPNDFATMMYVGVFCSYFCSQVKQHNELLKLFFNVLIILYIFLLLVSTSRANILGLFVSILVMLLIHKNYRVFGVATLICIIIAIPKAVSSLLEIIGVRFDFVGLGSDSYRLNLIHNGIDFFFNSFGFGVGCGQIEFWMSHYAKYNTGGVLNMHNWWIEILSAYGVVVFSLYIAFYSKVIKDNINIYKYSSNQTVSKLSLSISAMLLGFIVALTSASSNITCEYLWVFWAIIIAYQGIDKTTYNLENHDANYYESIQKTI